MVPASSPSQNTSDELLLSFTEMNGDVTGILRSLAELQAVFSPKPSWSWRNVTGNLQGPKPESFATLRSSFTTTAVLSYFHDGSLASQSVQAWFLDPEGRLDSTLMSSEYSSRGLKSSMALLTYLFSVL